MSGTTKYKNGEVTKSAFNNSMMLNLAFLLDTLNKQPIELPSGQEEEQSNMEGDKEKELISRKRFNPQTLCLTGLTNLLTAVQKKFQKENSL